MSSSTVRKSFLVFALLLFTAIGFNPVHANTANKIQIGQALGGIKIGGHVHTIASSLDQEFLSGGSDDSGSVDVNSLELGITSSPLKAVDANVTLLMEEGFPDGGAPGQDFDVDQAFVVISGNHRPLTGREGRGEFDVSPWYAKVGKQYIPFGTNMAYHTFDVISEPQTLALAETLESSFLLGYTPRSGLNAYGGVFSGDGGDVENGSTRDNEIDDIFLGVDYSNRFGSFSVEWMNNLNNSIALTGEAGSGANEIGGLSLYGNVSQGPARLQLAHVTALDEYTSGGLTAGVPAGPEPSATSVELTYGKLGRFHGRSIAGTLVYEQTDEWLDHPDEIYGAVVDVPVFDGVSSSVEFIQREYDSTFSTRLDEEQLISLRLAVGFEDVFPGSGIR